MRKRAGSVAHPAAHGCRQGAPGADPAQVKENSSESANKGLLGVAMLRVQTLALLTPEYVKNYKINLLHS